MISRDTIITIDEIAMINLDADGNPNTQNKI
jgi:hypothetical protein